jgi:hypothetical protein
MAIVANFAPEKASRHGMFFAALSAVDSSPRIHLLAALAMAAGFSACASGAGPDAPIDPTCVGSKCDEPAGPATPHALAVAACDQGHEDGLAASGGSADKSLAAWREYHVCLLSADNAAIATIELNLAGEDKLSLDSDAIAEVFEEFRYASLCSDLEAIATVVGDELALVASRCTTTRERSLAHVLSALVDYTGERSTVFFTDERQQFSECYIPYDASMAAGLEDSLVARQALVSCAGDDLRSDAEFVKDAYCALLGCPDDLLITSFIQAGFETAIDTSESTCEMLVDASIYVGEDGFEQVLNCRLSIYAQLRAATLDGLSE